MTTTTAYTNAKIQNGEQRNVSYGVIAYKDEDDPARGPTYCLVRRWHTFAFSDFIQGRYQLEDRDRIYQMFELMTLNEKEAIQAAPSFSALWQQYWRGGVGVKHSFKKEYKMAMHKYDMLVKGYSVSMPLTLGVKVSMTLQLATILANTSFLPSPEWGFPKGKRNHKHETPLMCAQRELKEETNLEAVGAGAGAPPHSPPQQFVESFVGSNGVRYEHIYYLAKCRDANTLLVCDPQNANQTVEIGDIGWFSYDECLQLFREQDYAKKNVLSQVHGIITNSCYSITNGNKKDKDNILTI
jgi:8-oxo-dGTP pyrophosphatase MutT (NUDIX family)